MVNSICTGLGGFAQKVVLVLYLSAQDLGPPMAGCEVMPVRRRVDPNIDAVPQLSDKAAVPRPVGCAKVV